MKKRFGFGSFRDSINRAAIACQTEARKPFAAAIFEQPLETPAWKSIRSWYLVAKDDQVIHPDLQRFMANRMDATTAEISGSHCVYISHPKTVAELIE